MNHNYTQTELLTRYLDGELEAVEVEEVQQLLTNSKEAQEELTRLEATQRALRLAGLKNQINHAIQKEKATAPVVKMGARKSYAKWISIAAMLVLLAGVGYQYASINTASIYEEAFVEYKTVVTRGEAQNQMDALYAAHNFDACLALFASMKEKTTHDNFLAALSYLNTNKVNEAISLLKPISNASVLETDAAQYYLAMAYLKSNDFEKSLPLFESIRQQSQHEYHANVTDWMIRKIKIARSKS